MAPSRTTADVIAVVIPATSGAAMAYPEPCIIPDQITAKRLPVRPGITSTFGTSRPAADVTAVPVIPTAHFRILITEIPKARMPNAFGIVATATWPTPQA